jgi:ABC-type phosphonate transport system ATPase subunit
MATQRSAAIVDDTADTRSVEHPRRIVMDHPEIMFQRARQHQKDLQDEAKRNRLVRNRSSVVHEEPRERFRVRDLRWLLFRPTGA